MDEQYRDLLLGLILLILIIDTIAIFSLVSGTALQTSSSRTVAEATAPVPSVTPTSPPAVSTTQLPVKTTIPTPTPVPARAGYVNIYSLQDRELETSLEPILFNLVRPPLIIYFSVTPENITDTKYFEYKMLDTEHHDSVNITRPYENADFSISVTDNDTGKVVAEDGFGKEYGLQSPKTLEVKERGNYTIRATGKYINLSLSIEVPIERNIP